MLFMMCFYGQCYSLGAAQLSMMRCYSLYYSLADRPTPMVLLVGKVVHSSSMSEGWQ